MTNNATAKPDTYLPAIEAEWMRLQETHRPLTPLDWAFADAWHDAGIPLIAVIAGMRRSFQSHKPRNPGDRIHSLSYCYQAIMDAREELAPQTAWERKEAA